MTSKNAGISTRVATAGIAIATLLSVGCGGVSYQYGTGRVHSIPGAASLRAVASEVIDARAGGRPLGNDQPLSQVRSAVREHLVRASVIAEHSPTLHAPSNSAELAAVLDDVAASGANEAVFVRFHNASLESGCGTSLGLAWLVGFLPWLIIDSIPLWQHGAFAAFEVVVVEPRSHQVLGRSMRVATFGEKVSAWGCGADGVMHDMMARSLQRALTDIVEQANQGWPSRGAVELDALILGGSTVVAEQGTLRGPGWSMTAPSWTLNPWDPNNVFRAAHLVSPDGVSLDVIVAPASNVDRSFVRSYRGQIAARAAGPLVGEREVRVDRFQGLQFDASVGGVHQIHRVTSTGGMAVAMVCAGSQSAVESHRAECERAFDSLAFNAELLTGTRAD